MANQSEFRFLKTRYYAYRAVRQSKDTNFVEPSKSSSTRRYFSWLSLNCDETMFQYLFWWDLHRHCSDALHLQRILHLSMKYSWLRPLSVGPNTLLHDSFLIVLGKVYRAKCFVVELYGQSRQQKHSNIYSPTFKNATLARIGLRP